MFVLKFSNCFLPLSGLLVLALDVPIADDVAERRCDATISTGGTENTTAHSTALLCIQSNLGLGDIMFNFLYSHHGE